MIGARTVARSIPAHGVVSNVLKCHDAATRRLGRTPTMKNHETTKYGFSLKDLNTTELDDLMASVLREMRRRDSDHMQGDVINKTHKLGKLRRTGRLP